MLTEYNMDVVSFMRLFVNCAVTFFLSSVDSCSLLPITSAVEGIEAEVVAVAVIVTAATDGVGVGG